ncbi:MAG: hypothetical protein GF365_02080 [Candidatus Buchananbacteria bacterium]|nr:hypothetical protein [Candidatus Buchananbacteria bacterium]
MNKKTLIIIVVIILVLAVIDIGVYLMFLKPVTKTNQNVNLAQPAELPKIEPQEYEPSEALAGTYYREQAFTEKSLEPCLQLENEQMKARCLNKAKDYLFETEANADFCLNYPNNRDKMDCVRKFAYNKEDFGYCNILDNDVLRADCLRYYAFSKIPEHDPANCNILENNEVKAECLNLLYYSIQECDKINDEGLKSSCETGVF